MDLPLVSVVVAAHDYERYLPLALDSALAQDLGPGQVEIVVVDDGSTDGTPTVLAGYGDRIRAFRQDNAGLNAATAAAIGHTRGRYIALLDADDEWRPDKLRLQVELLEARSEVGLVASDMELIDAAGGTIAPSYFRHHDLRVPEDDPLPALLTENSVPAPTIMVRASLLDRIVPIAAEASFQDWWMAFRVAEVAELAWIDQPLTRYRVHGDNMTAGSGGERALRNARKDMRFRRWMLSHVDPSLVSGTQLEEGWRCLADQAAWVSAQSGEALWADLPVGIAHRARALVAGRRARSALLAGDRDGALAHRVRARAEDPGDEAAACALEVAALGDAGDGGISALGPNDVRSFSVACSLAELQLRPDLLDAWTAAFGSDDDATLVVLADGHDTAWLAEHPGLARPDAPDVLALPLTLVDLELLAPDLTAVLSDEPELHALGLPVFTTGDGPTCLREAGAASRKQPELVAG